MIKVFCRTNVDEGKGKNWPKILTCRPEIGDRVEAEGSYYTLKVVGIKHTMKRLSPYSYEDNRTEAVLEVELNH